MRHIKLTLEYDGTNYAGFQSQKNAPSIQERVAKAIEKMTEEKTTLVGASRTDAGVHALRQVACFKTTRLIPCHGFLKGLNSLLPQDIRIMHCEEVSNDFHPTTDAKRKTYQYLLEVGEVPSPLLRDRVWCVPATTTWRVRQSTSGGGPRLDIEAMKEAANSLTGEHDFKSFQGAHSDAKTTVRRMEEIRIGPWTMDHGLWAKTDATFQRSIVHSPLSIVPLFFTGNGFLKYMVRNIVGTLVYVGIGKLSPSDVEKILKAKDRTLAGPTAPPQGLYLVKVEY